MTRREAVLSALSVALGAPGVPLPRNEADLSRIPAGGLVILHDGNPGRPELTLSPLTYHFQHRAELDVLIDAASAAQATAAFDAIAATIGARLAKDRTLGGLCDWCEAEAPAPSDVPVEGARPIRAATIGIILHYSAPDPLG